MFVKQAANVVDLLEFFARISRPATLAEISEAMSWPRSSAFNIVATLTQKGFLFEPMPRAGYYPTPRWLMLSKKIAEGQPLPKALHPVVEDLSRETGETALVAVQAGVSAMFLLVADSTHSIKYTTNVGHRVPLTATATGRAILAQLPEAERRKVYNSYTFEKFTETTLLSAEEVEQEIERSRERGYHFNSGGNLPDLFGISLPLAINGRPFAVTVAGPLYRMKDRASEVARLMRRRLTEQGFSVGC